MIFSRYGAMTQSDGGTYTGDSDTGKVYPTSTTQPVPPPTTTSTTTQPPPAPGGTTSQGGTLHPYTQSTPTATGEGYVGPVQDDPVHGRTPIGLPSHHAPPPIAKPPMPGEPGGLGKGGAGLAALAALAYLFLRR